MLECSASQPGRPSGPRVRYKRPYSRRVVGRKVMTPTELRRWHEYLLEVEKVSFISDEMRAVVESEWPQLAHKLPPRRQKRHLKPRPVEAGTPEARPRSRQGGRHAKDDQSNQDNEKYNSGGDRPPIIFGAPWVGPATVVARPTSAFYASIDHS
jgi:hypothetical protein